LLEQRLAVQMFRSSRVAAPGVPSRLDHLQQHRFKRTL
jgi:hypothetical protein